MATADVPDAASSFHLMYCVCPGGVPHAPTLSSKLFKAQEAAITSAADLTRSLSSLQLPASNREDGKSPPTFPASLAARAGALLPLLLLSLCLWFLDLQEPCCNYEQEAKKR